MNASSSAILKKLPLEITSYDLLKTFAVMIMVVDHMGFYFFPDDLWWRAVGRIGFPIWFFLVGYSTGRDIPAKLIGGALILLAANVVVGLPLFPLNALISIIIIRLTIEPVMAFALKSQRHLILCSAALFMLVLPSYFVTEYGTLGMITAMFGYFVRHKKKINNDAFVLNFMIFALLTFILYQQVFYGFSIPQFTFMAVGTCLVRLTLFYFQPQTYPGLTAKCPPPLAAFTRFCGRRTLEIYVAHLIAFKFLALCLGYKDFSLLTLHLL